MKKYFFLFTGILLFPFRGNAAVDVVTHPDGRRYTQVVFNGSIDRKYDIVFIGDGFTLAEQGLFNKKVGEAWKTLCETYPWSERLCAFNIWQVNVISEQSGVDRRAEGIYRNTELNCYYDAITTRLIQSETPWLCQEAASYAPAYDAIFVLVNDTTWGGAAGSLVFCSINPKFGFIVSHELGHFLGDLADEYDCYVCDGSDDNRSYFGGEPWEANLTNKKTLAEIKWKDLINPGTPLPTGPGVSPGTVGIWEGGGYYRFGMYRSQFDCHMRSRYKPFCQVCARHLLPKLESRCDSTDIRFFTCQLSALPLRKISRPRLFWKFPPCLSCPFEDPLVRFIFELSDPRIQSGQAVVRNTRGEIVAQQEVSERQKIRISFEGLRFEEYSLEIHTTEQAAGLNGLKPIVTINGKEMAGNLRQMF